MRKSKDKCSCSGRKRYLCSWNHINLTDLSHEENLAYFRYSAIVSRQQPRQHDGRGTLYIQ
jgi:hypothetical protein